MSITDIDLIIKNMENYFSHLKYCTNEQREIIAEAALNIILPQKEMCSINQNKIETNEKFIVEWASKKGKDIEKMPQNKPLASLRKNQKGKLSLRINRKGIKYLDDAKYVNVGLTPSGQIIIAKSETIRGSKITLDNNGKAGSIAIPAELSSKILKRKYKYNDYFISNTRDEPFKMIIISPI